MKNQGLTAAMYVLSVPLTSLSPAMYCSSVVKTPTLLSSAYSTGGGNVEKFKDNAPNPRLDAASEYVRSMGQPPFHYHITRSMTALAEAPIATYIEVPIHHPVVVVECARIHEE